MSIRITQQLAVLSLIEDEPYMELLSITPRAIHLHMNVPEQFDAFINVLNLIAAYMNLRYRADNRPFTIYLNGRAV